MPPKTPAPKPKTPPATTDPPPQDELLGRLAAQQFELTTAHDKLGRLATVHAALGSEVHSLGSTLTAERTQFGDINAYLKRALQEQALRADGLERQLQTAREQLLAAQRAAAADARAAEQRRQAEVGGKQAELDSQHDRMQQAEAYLKDRDSLQARADALEAQLVAEKQQHHTARMDLERKHAADRELWRREMQEAVRQAREEMAALTDQRLDATTRQTILENEAMAGELQYQGHHVQGILHRNTALQQETAQLRVALSVSKGSEEALAKKVLGCEHTIESLLTRLQALEEQRGASAQEAAELREQLATAQQEAQAARQAREQLGSQVQDLNQRLDAERQQLQQLRAANDDAANFLLMCLADARQQLLAERGRAAMAAAATPGKPGKPPAALRSTSSPAAGSCSGSWEPFSSSISGASSKAHSSVVGVQLADLPAQQREAVLVQLLEQLPVEWRQREGLVLPASGPLQQPPSSSAQHSTAGGCVAQQASTVGEAHLNVPSFTVHASCSTASTSTEASALSAGGACDGGGSSGNLAAQSCSSAELLQHLKSEVRPWGERADRVAPGRRQGTASGGGSRESGSK